MKHPLALLSAVCALSLSCGHGAKESASETLDTIFTRTASLCRSGHLVDTQ